VLRAYRGALRTRPGLTNCLAGGMIMLSSDLVCQRLVERPPKADVSRALGALTLGLAWHGVAVGVVLRKVRDVADRFGVESLLLDAALCAFLTQAFMAVTGNTVNMGVRKLFAGGYRDVAALALALRAELPAVIKLDWIVFPPFQLFLFTAVPAHLRVVFTASAMALWGVYMSHASARVAFASP